MSTDRDRVTVTRTVPAPPEQVFALLADPARHPEIDGSGTVQQSRSGSRRLGEGDWFGMAMRMGGPYVTRNQVVACEEGRRLSWRTHGPPPIRFFGGPTWHYELEPTDDGGTRIHHTWDLATERGPVRPLVRRAAGPTRRNMERTLARIEEAVTT